VGDAVSALTGITRASRSEILATGLATFERESDSNLWYAAVAPGRTTHRAASKDGAQEEPARRGRTTRSLHKEAFPLRSLSSDEASDEATRR